jgi:hypothetical protein
LPYFAFDPETPSDVAGRAAGPLLLLLATAPMANIAGFAWMLRYPLAGSS